MILLLFYYFGLESQVKLHFLLHETPLQLKNNVDCLQVSKLFPKFLKKIDSYR